MSVGSHLLLPSLHGCTNQRLAVSPYGGSLLLRHVDFPYPHALRLPWAGYVGFRSLSRLWYRERVRSVGFPLPSFPGSFDVLRLLAGGALAQLLSISLYCRIPFTLQARLSPSYPWTLILRPRHTQLAWNAPGLASPSSLVGTGDQPGTQAAFPRFCSSTPILLPQECCKRRSFLPACAPAGLPRGNPVRALSVRRLQCGASSHCFVLLRLLVGLTDRCLGPTHAQL
jgi:hypothetical protein